MYSTVPYLTSRDGLPCHVSGAVFLPRKITVNFFGKSDARKLKTRPVAFSQPRRAAHILELQALRFLREVYAAGESVRVWLAVPHFGFMILASLVARGGAQDPSISETFLRILPSNLLSRASLPSRLHDGGGGGGGIPWLARCSRMRLSTWE